MWRNQSLTGSGWCPDIELPESSKEGTEEAGVSTGHFQRARTYQVSYEYKVVRGKLWLLGYVNAPGMPVDEDTFTPAVQKHLDEGWELVGGVAYFAEDDRRDIVMQAMKREKR